MVLIIYPRFGLKFIIHGTERAFRVHKQREFECPFADDNPRTHFHVLGQVGTLRYRIYARFDKYADALRAPQETTSLAAKELV